MKWFWQSGKARVLFFPPLGHKKYSGEYSAFITDRKDDQNNEEKQRPMFLGF